MNPFFNKEEKRIRAGWRMIGQYFLMVFIALIITSVLRLIISSSGSFMFVFSMTVGAALSTWAAARGLDKRTWLNFGIWVDKKWISECLTGFTVAAAAMGFIFAIEYAAGWLTVTGFGWQQTLNQPYIWTFLSYLLLMILVGFWEELVFRGYQMINLSEGLNLSFISRRQAAVLALILTSALFGLLHLRNPNADWLSTFNIAVAGFMLGFPFLITGRLSYSMGLHTGWNFFQGGVFGFAVSGLRNNTSLIQINQTGPPLFTGGVFGPEAGLLGLLGIIAIISFFVINFKIKGQSIAVHNRFGTYEG